MQFTMDEARELRMHLISLLTMHPFGERFVAIQMIDLA